MLVGGAAIAGVISGSKSLVDGAFDVAFDNPEADRAFTGGDIGPGYISSQIVGGPIGAAGKALGPVGQAAGAAAAGPAAVGGGMLAGVGTVGLAGSALAYGASELIGKGENLAAKMELTKIRASRLRERANLHLALGGDFRAPSGK
jgi:hypothetical protein